jgi:hypothetical protein
MIRSFNLSSTLKKTTTFSVLSILATLSLFGCTSPTTPEAQVEPSNSETQVLSLRSKSEVGSQKSEVFFNNLMVKTFYFTGGEIGFKTPATNLF